MLKIQGYNNSSKAAMNEAALLRRSVNFLRNVMLSKQATSKTFLNEMIAN